MNILANDGISPSGLAALKEAGHTVYTDFVEAGDIETFINENANAFAELLRSAACVLTNCIFIKIRNVANYLQRKDFELRSTG